MITLLDWRLENQDDLRQFTMDTAKLDERAAESIYRRGSRGISEEVDRPEFLDWLGHRVERDGPLLAWVHLEQDDENETIMLMDSWVEWPDEQTEK